jgi:hypothetical protein
LDSGTGVEHQGKERVVAPPEGGAPIDALQERLDLRCFEVLDRRLPGTTFEGQPDDLLQGPEALGSVRSDESGKT